MAPVISMRTGARTVAPSAIDFDEGLARLG